MSLEDDENLFDEEIAVPEKLRRALHRNRRGIDYVNVERQRGRGRWFKVTKVEVEIDPKNATDAQLDLVGTEAVRLAESDAESRGDTGNYRIKIFRTDSRGSSMKPTATFRAGEDDEDDEDDVPPRRSQDPSGDYEEDDMGVVAFIMQQQMDMLRASHEQNLKLIDRVIKTSSTTTGSIEKLNTTIESLAVNYTLGINMQAEALQLIYAQQAAEKEAELKADTHKSLMKILAKAAPEAFKQFGAYMGKKAAASVEVDEDDEDDEDVIDVQAAASQESEPQTKEQRALQAMTEEQREAFKRAPLTMTAKTFREALEGEQLIQISRAMTKKDYELFLSAMEQDDDIATAKKVMKLKEVLEKKLDVALGLMSVFDEAQQQVLAAILSQAEKIQEHLDQAEDS